MKTAAFSLAMVIGLFAVCGQAQAPPQFVLTWGKKGDAPGEFHSPITIVIDKNDEIFVAAGAAPYKRDIPNVEIRMFDTGHFALETNGLEIAKLIREFLARAVPAPAHPS